MSKLLTTGIREREDLSDVVDVLMLNADDMKMCSFIRQLPSISSIFGQGVMDQKHEWFDDEARPMTFLSGTSGGGLLWDDAAVTALLPINSAYTALLRVGDMFVLGDLAEVVRISAINVAGNTVTVSARGHGSSSGAAQGTAAFNMKYIGNAQDENSDVMDSNFQAPSEKYNLCQTFEDVAGVSGTIRRSKTVAGDVHDNSVVKKLKELLKALNSALVEGLRDKTGTIATMGGIREFLATTSNVGGALSLAKFYTAFVAHIDAGLFPHAIHASATVISTIEQLFNTGVRTKPSEVKGGQSINVVAIMGHDVELHVDRDMRTGEFLILDYNRIAYGPLEGGSHEDGNFATYLIEASGKKTKTQVLGEYTCRVSNGGATKAYGIT